MGEAGLSFGCFEGEKGPSSDGSRTMEIDVRVQVFALKDVDRLGVLGTDVAESDVFANDRANLGLPLIRCRRNAAPATCFAR